MLGLPAPRIRESSHRDRTVRSASTWLECLLQDLSAAQALSKTLITEVWEVVDNSYLDARGTGWDREKWRGLRDKALSQTHRDVGSAHRCDCKGGLL